jgi:hypothetical protein
MGWLLQVGEWQLHYVVVCKVEPSYKMAKCVLWGGLLYVGLCGLAAAGGQQLQWPISKQLH